MRKNNLAKELVELKTEHDQRVLSLTEYYENTIEEMQDDHVRVINKFLVLVMALIGYILYLHFFK